jgi:hypothetical protein
MKLAKKYTTQKKIDTLTDKDKETEQEKTPISDDTFALLEGMELIETTMRRILSQLP